MQTPLQEQARALAARDARVREPFRRLLSGSPLCPTDRCAPPRVGVCLSGGGQRACTSAIGFLDGLSQIGVLDCVSVVTCLSGGSWALRYLSEPEEAGNPFRNTLNAPMKHENNP